jgi:hypothetical protein
MVARYAEKHWAVGSNRASNARFLVTTREYARSWPGEEIFALGTAGAVRCGCTFPAQGGGGEAGISRRGSEDQLAIDPLVKLLEGLPLAIELAGSASAG